MQVHYNALALWLNTLKKIEPLMAFHRSTGIRGEIKCTGEKTQLQFGLPQLAHLPNNPLVIEFFVF